MPSTRPRRRSPRPPPLVLLAGGLGRRFGGDKQVEPVGPAGEPLGAYTAFDALEVGFGEIVLVTRPGAEASVHAAFTAALGGRGPVRCVPQRLPLPRGVEAPAGRTRPWGTAHATLAAAAVVDAPFAVANADDAYGREALATLREALEEADDDEAVLVTYPAGRVLSSAGGVSRGWVRPMGGGAPSARLEGAGPACEVVEIHHLRHRTGCAMLEGVTEAGAAVAFPPDTPVSMNLWGLPPGVVRALAEGWHDFGRTLSAHPAGPLEAEYGLSTSLTALAREGRVRLRPRAGGRRWFGMTFPEDRSRVMERLEALHADGTYPPTLAAPPLPEIDA